MPPEVNVATSPMVVYGMLAVFGVAIVLALVFARPRRGLGAIKRADVADRPAAGPPWMPGGDILGREPQPEQELPAVADPWQPATDPWQARADQWPAADPWQAVPPVAPPAGATQPSVHDPWSTGATGSAEPQPRWDKR